MNKGISGIYAIRHTVSGQIYVGSSGNIASRWRAHLSQLRTGKHHAPPLQIAFDKYGEEAFDLSIIEERATADFKKREQYWINLYSSSVRGCGFNASDLPGGGRPRTVDTDKKEAASETVSFKLTPSQERRLASVLNGRKRSEFARQCLLAGIEREEFYQSRGQG